MKRNILRVLFVLIAGLVVIIIASIIFIPFIAEQNFGSASPDLNFLDKFTYSINLLMIGNDLSSLNQTDGKEKTFVIEPGESINQISMHLELLGLIKNSRSFGLYLVWKGLDKTVQAGNFRLNPGMTSMEIANALQDATPEEVTFNILAGWRMEEIAASLPTSGLIISTEDFIKAVKNPVTSIDFLPLGASAEGFLFPGSYILTRDTSADKLVSVLIQNFSLYLSNDLRERYSLQGLNVYQAIILASIVEREAVVVDEQPIIASVFFNRLKKGMKLESDPTVQYAIGFDKKQGSWWKNPLTLDDLNFDSPFNTYIYNGLPPTPISNPNLSALQAVAYPALTSYYYFRARCDGSGLHAFAETFEQHIQNGCK